MGAAQDPSSRGRPPRTADGAAQGEYPCLCASGRGHLPSERFGPRSNARARLGARPRRSPRESALRRGTRRERRAKGAGRIESRGGVDDMGGEHIATHPPAPRLLRARRQSGGRQVKILRETRFVYLRPSARRGAPAGDGTAAHCDPLIIRPRCRPAGSRGRMWVRRLLVQRDL